MGKIVRLEGQTTSGKIKYIIIEAVKDELITRWGLVGSDKVQETKEKCEAKNVGKKNFISAEAQAILRLERKIKKKMESGYTVPGAVHLVDKFPNLFALQKQFAPCKPIAKPPKDALSGGYLADRKYNGVNLIITKDKNGFGHIYTRRVDDITENLEDLPEFEKVVKAIPPKSMLLIELIYVNNNRVEEPEHLRALINKRRSKEAVHERYHKINKNGKIALIVFDVMFWNGKNMCDVPFLKRRGGLDSMMSFRVPVAVKFTQRLIDLQKGKWEGFILRKLDGKITYTMNGKAKRFGSWKWKYEITDDFIVVGAEHGRGKHDKYFARFKLAQYDKDGHFVDCGYCGPGNLKVEELKDLYLARKTVGDTYQVQPYMVIEVQFRARASGGVKLEFPVFKRIRDDKKPTECVYNES